MDQDSSHHEQRGQDPEDDDRDKGGLEPRVQGGETPRQHLGAGERIAEPRNTDQPCIGGDEQDGEGEEPHPDPGPERECLRHSAEARDDARDRVRLPGCGEVGYVAPVGVRMDWKDTQPDGR